MNPSTLVAAMTEPGFLIGFGLGGVAGAAALAHRRASAWVLSSAVALLIALLLADQLGSLVVPSVGLVALASVAVGISAVGAAQISRRHGAGVAFACLALSALGVWGTVPDTENSTVLLGAVAGASLGAFRIRATASWWVWIPIIGGAAALAITEGQGRVSAPLGALATLGVLVVNPAVDRTAVSTPTWLLVSVHVLLVILGGRVAGTAGSATVAAVLALAGLVLGGVLLAWSGRRLTLAGRHRPT